MKISLTILGEPASKANSRQLVSFSKPGNKRPALIKSEKAREYEAAALLQIPASAKVMLRGPVRVTMRIYYASERPDLDESVVLDVLQTKFVKGSREIERPGVYINDRQVREKHVFHAVDASNPRAEIEVEPLEASLFEELPAVPTPAKTRRKRPPQFDYRQPAMTLEGDPF